MTHAEGADTLIGVLEDAARAGFSATLAPVPHAIVLCGVCDARCGAADLEIKHYRRLEGASDAADMMLIALTHCPTCGAAGTITLGYGPNGGENDADVLGALDLRNVPSGPIS